MKRVGSIWYFKGKVLSEKDAKHIVREWIPGGNTVSDCIKSFLSYYKN